MVSVKLFSLVMLVLGLMVGYLLAYLPNQQILNENIQKNLILESEKEKLKKDLQDLQKELDSKNNEVKDLISSLQISKEEIAKLREEILKKDLNLQQMEKDIKSKDEIISSKSKELEDLKKSLDNLSKNLNNIKGALTRINNDKELLSRLRIVPEPNREATRNYWLETKEIAIKVNPNLGRIIDRILDRIDAYFNWIDELGSNPNVADYVIWLITAPPAVIEYSNEVNNFQDQAILSIIDDLNYLIELLR